MQASEFQGWVIEPTTVLDSRERRDFTLDLLGPALVDLKLEGHKTPVREALSEVISYNDSH